jgi:hypothetical protein
MHTCKDAGAHGDGWTHARTGMKGMHSSELAGTNPKARCAVQSVASVFVFTEKPWKGVGENKEDTAMILLDCEQIQRHTQPNFSCGQVDQR